jgi:hypothetical protein
MKASMMTDLITKAALDECVGDIFQAELGGQTLTFELILVRRIESANTQGDRPFAAEFRGPLEPVYSQSIYKLENQKLGTRDFFLVPVERGDKGVIYESVFN